MAGNHIDISNLLLGYTPEMRLAFLRKMHADPVDVYPTAFNLGSADTSLPNFDNAKDQGQALDEAWIKFRRDTNLDLLRELYVAAKMASASVNPGLSILIKQRRQGEPDLDDTTNTITFPPGWYGSWDDPQMPPPTLFTAWEEPSTDADPLISAADAIQARMQSHQVIAPFNVKRLQTDGADAAALKKEIGKPSCDGFVLDLSDDPYGDDGDGADPLTRLASDAKPL
jgi:hypothetical protein